MNQTRHLTPACIIYVDGKRLDVAHEGMLRQIVINDKLNGLSSFSILFDTSETRIADKGLLSLESKLSIHLGYKDDAEEVFTGEVLSMKAKQSEYGTEQLEVSGCNVLHKLSCGEQFQSFKNKTPSEIIKGVIDMYSLKAEVDDFGASREFTSEDGCSDYEYLMRTAALYGNTGRMCLRTRTRFMCPAI